MANYNVYSFFYFGAISMLMILPFTIAFWFLYILHHPTGCLKPCHLHNTVRNMFSVFKAASDDTKDNPHTLLFDHYRVPDIQYILQLFFFFISIICYSVAIFWEEFLFEVWYNCDPSILNQNCFNYTNSNENNHDYINCSDKFEDVDVICFKLIFDWYAGMQSAGGISLMSSLIVGFISWLILKVTLNSESRLPPSSRRGLCVIFLQFFAALFALVSGGVYPFLRAKYIYKVEWVFWGHFLKSVQFATVFAAALLTPWYHFRLENQLRNDFAEH